MRDGGAAVWATQTHREANPPRKSIPDLPRSGPQCSKKLENCG
jgi:hypothetical protein